jgi:hypothetical protein
MNDVKTHLIDQEPLPPELKWPRLQWRTEMWLTFIPFLLSFLVFFWPELAAHKSLQYIRIPVGIALFLTPALVPVLAWLYKTGSVVCRRAHHYPSLRQRAEREIDDLDEMKKNLFDILQAISPEPLFEIARARYYQNKLLIVLNKRKSPRLAKGDILVAVDMEDAKAMGLFEVTEVRDAEYYAISIRGIDAVWLGFARQQRETRIMPNMRAIPLP